MKEKNCHYKINYVFEEETSRMQHLGRSCVWGWNLDSSDSRSEIAGEF